MDDIKDHGDFKEWYDVTQKRHIWTLGYFGGGSVNIVDAYSVAERYAKDYDVPIETVCIDEILSSRRYKGFKFVYSVEEQVPSQTACKMDNVYGWLRD